MSLTTLFAVVLLPALLGLMGLVADGGQILVARREVQGLAESAAHAGAAQLDISSARATDDHTGGALDPRAAEFAAARYVSIQEPGLNATVRADTRQVTVRVSSRPIQMTFLRLAGIMQIQVTGDATAEPRTGVLSGR